MTAASSDIVLERMMALHPKIIDLTLDRVWRLLGALGNPQDRLPPVVHIAGTNGKGSTQAMLRAGLEADGHKVHAYTSPHLARFHERIRLAGTLVSEPALTDLLDRCYELNNGENITYFEITTCAALLAFAETAADYTLLEVGLGGRLDATNVVKTPAACVITPVDLDHQTFLGDTIEKIAFEKAGILKRGVPCVVGPQHDAALDVIETQAQLIGAPLLVHGQQWHATTERGRLIYQDDTGLLDMPLPNLIGPHQIQNAGAALAVLRYLEKSDTAFTGAVTNAEWPARMQRLSVDGDVWLDGGHNPAAAKAIARTLDGQTPKPTTAICGMINTKDVAGFLSPLAPHISNLIAVTIPDEESAVPAGDIAAAAKSVGIRATIAPSFENAFQSARSDKPNNRILICGSLYLAGHVLRSFEV